LGAHKRRVGIVGISKTIPALSPIVAYLIETSAPIIHEEIKYTEDEVLLRSFAKDLELAEFELQKLWGFPEDSKFHRFWHTPKCTCPKLDNDDNYPSGYYSINLQCKLHGGLRGN
jgi:hypothetical protein